MQEVKHLIKEANADLLAMAGKGGVGVAGSLAAMSINDLAGLIVAILTAIYMVLQIEASWRKRKEAVLKKKKLKKEDK